jgi:hypothetical protein
MEFSELTCAIRNTLNLAVQELERNPSKETAESACMASRVAWALFLPEYLEFDFRDEEVIGLFRDLLRRADAALHKPELNARFSETISYAKNVRRRLNQLRAIQNQDLAELGRIQDEVLFEGAVGSAPSKST